MLRGGAADHHDSAEEEGREKLSKRQARRELDLNLVPLPARRLPSKWCLGCSSSPMDEQSLTPSAIVQTFEA